MRCRWASLECVWIPSKIRKPAPKSSGKCQSNHSEASPAAEEGKGTCALWVGVKPAAATVDSRVQVPQEVINRTTVGSSNHSWVFIRRGQKH